MVADNTAGNLNLNLDFDATAKIAKQGRTYTFDISSTNTFTRYASLAAMREITNCYNQPVSTFTVS